MAVTSERIARSLRSFTQLFSDKSLTRKATLNAFASALDYAARLVVGFIITPFLVGGLGEYYYGAWQILNRLVGYISPASGRPTQALKFTLAKAQHSTDFAFKRRNVGATLAVWAMFLPLLAVLGAVLAWFAPTWLDAPAGAVMRVRLAAFFLVVNLAAGSLGSIPQSVMEGENLGYKRMGLSALLVFVGGGLTWAALALNTGLAGVACAMLLSTVLSGAFYLSIVGTYARWFGLERPSPAETRHFLGLSGWFLGWNLIMNLMTASDLVVFGLLESVEAVTAFSLTKYAPETIISLVAMMTFGIAPGLGGIIGSGDLKRAARLRGEMMSLTWLLVTVLGAAILLWNPMFLSLWVGEQFFVGPLPGLLIVLVVLQFTLIRNDANLIDLTLDLRRKVVLGGVAVAISLAAAVVLVGVFDLGVSGVCIGFILGRLLLSLGYPRQVGRFLGVPFSDQLRAALRPALVTALVFALASVSNQLLHLTISHGLLGWIELALMGLISLALITPLVFFAGLSAVQRERLVNRLIHLIHAPTTLEK